MAMVGVASGCLQAACGQPTGRLTSQVVWPGVGVGSFLAPFHIHHMIRVNSRSGSCYDDSTINIIMVIIVIIIIVINHVLCIDAVVWATVRVVGL